MKNRHAHVSRRAFLAGVAGAVAAGTAAWPTRGDASERELETRRLRMPRSLGICIAPQYVAEDLLRAEGFTDVQYINVKPDDVENLVASGDADVSTTYGVRLVHRLDSGLPITAVAGVHSGCNELFVTDRIRSLRDLRGRTVAVGTLGGIQHHLVAIVLAHIGLDWRKDVKVEVHSSADAIRLLGEGKVDAFYALPPEPQELRARQIGHVLLDNGRDRPWSQYFCCMLAANRDFQRKHPVATKRAVRAILKAADLCSREPDRVARQLVDRQFTANYDYARATLREVGYRAWRDLDPEETIRFYALRMREAGFVKSAPQKLISEGTDWRILNELRTELKS
jgi:NitT/TauT family transport system substrate-binding protein